MIRLTVNITDVDLEARLAQLGRYEKGQLLRRGLRVLVALEAQGYTVDDQGRIGRVMHGFEPAPISQPVAQPKTEHSRKPDPAFAQMLEQFDNS